MKWKISVYNTWCSQAVTHPSTNHARRCLTSVIGREPVFSTWYGRRHKTVSVVIHTVDGGYSWLVGGLVGWLFWLFWLFCFVFFCFVFLLLFLLLFFSVCVFCFVFCVVVVVVVSCSWVVSLASGPVQREHPPKLVDMLNCGRSYAFQINATRWTTWFTQNSVDIAGIWVAIVHWPTKYANEDATHLPTYTAQLDKLSTKTTHTYLAREVPWSAWWSSQDEAFPLHSGLADPCDHPKCGWLECVIFS